MAAVTQRALAVAMVLLCAAGAGNAARILALLPFAARSHYISTIPVAEELARRGHQVTLVTAFPRSSPLANLTELVVNDVFPERGTEKFNAFTMGSMNPFAVLLFLAKMGLDTCEQTVIQPTIQKLIHSDRLDYDLLLYEPFMQECLYGFIHKLKGVPSVQISSNTITPWMGDGMGNPHFFSFVPELLIGFTDHMTFSQRLYNAVVGVYTLALRHFYSLPKMEALMRHHFGDDSLPGVRDLETRASLLLLNSHPVFSFPRPLTPNTVEVGGLHIKPSKNLPQDLKKWVEDSKDGVVVFSLGTNARSVDMPERMRNAFVNSFSRMRQRILWKWEGDVMPNQPSNVRIAKWIPQSDMLGHPNVKAVIIHAGLLSTIEAAFRGMPAILVPIMGDQFSNALRAQDMGYAIRLDLSNITEESLSWALDQIVNNPRYRENAKKVAELLRDQPQPPLDRAMYWIEYVLRHGGASHMRSAAVELNLMQYVMVDAFAVAALVSLLVAFLVMRLCRRMRAVFCGRGAVHAAKKNN